MASLIKPGNVKIITKEGEIQVSLTLDININMNTEGLLSQGIERKSIETELEKKIKKEEDFAWEIPSFEEGSKIEFGK